MTLTFSGRQFLSFSETDAREPLTNQAMQQPVASAKYCDVTELDRVDSSIRFIWFSLFAMLGPVCQAYHVLICCTAFWTHRASGGLRPFSKQSLKNSAAAGRGSR
jgi:hypothetical protein